MQANPPTTFGDLLRAYRRAAGLTQQQLAERAGLSVHGVQKLERGATHAYRDTAQRLMVALQLEPDQKASFQAAVVPVRRHSSPPRDETTDRALHNLPLPLTNLVGREGAIAEVMRRLADTRLLTLTGIGGCGKTRLALEVARTAIDDYSHGAWLVELGPLADRSLVVARVAGVFGLRESGEQPLTTALANALRNRHVLLVLDNCEHLLDACAQLLDGLLRICPDLRVLATSREPIGIDGEATWRVPSLALPADSSAAPEQLLLSPAVQLFVQRAVAAQPRFALTARNASAVVQICRRLDGIPLALELAAARAEALTAEQVALRLDARFRLLTGGSRAALPRQQTLAATLDWSYDLLSRPERSLFERLAVFSGGWVLEAAEEVCADSGLQSEDVLDVLANLTRKSLVIAEETTNDAERYFMLETVRDYARQKLASRTAAQIRSLRNRHAGFFGRWVRHLLPDIFGRLPAEGSRRETDPFARLDADYDNVRSALAWLLESGQAGTGVRLTDRLWRYWAQRGLDGEALRWLGALRELADRTSHGGDGETRMVADRDTIPLAERAKLITGLASLTLRQGDYAEARALAEESTSIWRELSDDLALAVALAELGLAAWLLGDWSTALEHLDESRRVFDRCDRNPVTVAFSTNTLRNLGIVARSRGEHARAAQYFHESIIQARRGATTAGYAEARGLSHLGRALFLQGEVVQAKRVFGEALGIMQTERLAGHTLADCLDWLAPVADADGRPRDAAVLFGTGQAQWQASGTVRYAPERTAYAAEVASAQTQLRPDEFTAAWEEGHAMSREQAVAYALEQTRA